MGAVGEPRLSLLACACVLGWLNLAAGPCAQNALTAITPLAMGKSKKTWYQATVAYTLAGLFSSVSIGVLLGAVGATVGADDIAGTLSVSALGGVAAYTVLREGAGINLPLVQAKRSSRMSFARLGQPRAAVLWGLDVGSFFSTWLTFAGAWWLVAACVLSGNLQFAAALLGAHWLGRSALVWLGRWLIPVANQGHRLPAAWSTLHRPFQRLYASVVLGATVLIALV